MNKHIPVFSFKQADGKWESMINAQFLYYYVTTVGLPEEYVIDEIQSLPKEKILKLKLDSWKMFNTIDK